MMIKLKQFLCVALLRPYIYRELPGWGYLYNIFIGGYGRDSEWVGQPQRWIRGKRHGYEMMLDVGRWSNRVTYFLGRFYDLPTQLVLEAILRPQDSFVDIGANEGMISLLASRLVGKGGQVVSFEPNPQPRAKFQLALDRNGISNIRLFDFALGAKAGVLPLTVPKVNTGEGSFGKLDYPPELVDVVECEIRVGDFELKDIEPRLVKIDVEGFECQVIRGLQGVLERHRPAVVTEVVASHLARAQSSPLELAGLMKGYGYSPFELELSKDKRLRLKSAEIGPDAHGDFLWLHQHNKIVDPLKFR